ncbi:UDP-N-acetylglucosamine-dolichyl [Lyophyllum atratum]|nr:UDP-N-acetylglucosamine-dolichyl [Lyophyllum atratum]
MHSLPPRPLPRVLLLGLVPVAAWFVVRPLLDPVPPLPALYTSVGFSIFAFLSTIYLVPALGPTFVKAGLKGGDLLKPYRQEIPIPESQGLVCASIYIMLLILFIPFAFSNIIMDLARISVVQFPHYQLSVYLSSLLSLLIATLLGFLDDVFDIAGATNCLFQSSRLSLSSWSTTPSAGNTHVVVPLPLRFLFGALINLGPLYYIYMSLLSTFATNSINILAGINGSEVSQALIIAVSVEFGGVWNAGMAHGSRELVERHLFSLYFMMPLVAVCLGFLYHNWYPARAFPGDTLCYVTGMAFAVVGIQAHFSKTLLLFFIPQIFNFIMSCPQLFGLVPNPRHRVQGAPSVLGYDPETNLLYPSTTEFIKPPSKLSTLALGLTELTQHPRTGAIQKATNLTILNFFLIRLGPMHEKRLVQVAGSVFAFVVRYGLAGLVYDGDRR